MGRSYTLLIFIATTNIHTHTHTHTNWNNACICILWCSSSWWTLYNRKMNAHITVTCAMFQTSCVLLYAYTYNSVPVANERSWNTLLRHKWHQKHWHMILTDKLTTNLLHLILELDQNCILILGCLFMQILAWKCTHTFLWGKYWQSKSAYICFAYRFVW